MLPLYGRELFPPSGVRCHQSPENLNRRSVRLMRAPGPKPGLLFRLVIPATSVFVVTILSMIAVAMGDGLSPVAQFLDRHGNLLLSVEFVGVVSLTLLALIYGRSTGSGNDSATGNASEAETRRDP
jgi:hypothetical protein